MLSKKFLIIIALIAILTAASSVYAYSSFITNQNSKVNDSNYSLFVESFSPVTIGSNLTGGKIVLVNPTDKTFENLTLSAKIDNSELIIPSLRLWMHLPIDKPFDYYNVPITQISIEPYQNETIQLYLFDPDQNEPPFYETSVSVQTFSSHVFRFYITQNTFGDIINGQSFTIPQEKAYLQITGYSSIEHTNDTWHEQFNSNTNRYEYINDQPNFYQQYHLSRFFPLEPSSYNWAKTLNQIGEHYFNVTVFNNTTFPLEKIALNLGEGWVEYALPDKILQPNKTYVFPVQTGGENWWSVDNVNQLSNFNPSYTYASGNLIS